MIDAIFDTYRMVVLQILGVDGALWDNKSERFFQSSRLFCHIERNPTIPSVSKVFCLRHMMSEIFCASSSI